MRVQRVARAHKHPPPPTLGFPTVFYWSQAKSILKLLFSYCYIFTHAFHLQTHTRRFLNSFPSLITPFISHAPIWTRSLGLFPHHLFTSVCVFTYVLFPWDPRVGWEAPRDLGSGPGWNSSGLFLCEITLPDIQSGPGSGTPAHSSPWENKLPYGETPVVLHSSPPSPCFHAFVFSLCACGFHSSGRSHEAAVMF